MTTSKKIPIKLLDFDPENPRFDGVRFEGDETLENILKRMIEEENLDELVGSIGNQGFFPGEPLLVAPNPSSIGRYIVVEGNRRLAALYALGGLIKPENLSNSISELVAQATNKPTEVDCFEFPHRRDILKYLGFRHISGPRRWEPLAKARYLADLIKNFYSHLNLIEQLRWVARDIGSRRDYVAQLLTALNLYDHAKNKSFYGLQRVDEADISFSLLTTALSYNNIVAFLNLDSRDAVTVDQLDVPNFKELLSWMFAQDQNGKTVVGESRQLKTLAAVVASPNAVAELRNHGDLNRAYDFTSGPAEAFNKLLAGIEADLARSIALLSEVDIDNSHLAQTERIASKAEDLSLLVQKAISREKRSRKAALVGAQDE